MNFSSSMRLRADCMAQFQRADDEEADELSDKVESKAELEKAEC